MLDKLLGIIKSVNFLQEVNAPTGIVFILSDGPIFIGPFSIGGFNMFTKIDLCSMALLKLGEKPIQSWHEDSIAAQLSRSLFDSTVDSLMAMFPWRFATQKIVLIKNTDGDFVIPSHV